MARKTYKRELTDIIKGSISVGEVLDFLGWPNVASKYATPEQLEEGANLLEQMDWDYDPYATCDEDCIGF